MKDRRLDDDESHEHERTPGRFTLRITLGEVIVLGGLVVNVISFWVQGNATRDDLLAFKQDVRMTIEQKLQTRER